MKKEKTFKEEMEDTRFEIGSGSVYEDLGYKNHKEMEIKAYLVMEISKAIKTNKLTQIKASEILGISQPKLSELLSGHFRGYSIERLIRFLNDLGQDVVIVVKTKPKNRKAHVRVHHLGGGTRSIVPLAAKRP